MKRASARSAFFAACLGVLLLAGCEHNTPLTGPATAEVEKDNTQFVIQNDNVMLEQSGSLSRGSATLNPGHSQLLKELLETHRATARYRNINNAIADGYVDINVVVPHMGFHYMKASLADANFDPSHPEILVYNYVHPGNHPTLVAVEFAVPIPLSQDPPEGFTGEFDVWERNEVFGLWLLHAWVWYPNPTGVFSAANPLVP